MLNTCLKANNISNADPSDHLIEDIAAGSFSAVPQKILDALPKYLLCVQICVHFETGPGVIFLEIPARCAKVGSCRC